MKQRSPAAVFLLSLITFGIYALVWEVKTKGELNKLGADIPTAWLLIIPLANLYWVWKYSQGVEKVSGGQISAVLTLILMLLLSIVGFAILQSEYNKISPQPAGAGPAPGGPDMGAQPIAAAPTVPAGPTEPTTPAPLVTPDIAPPAPGGFGGPVNVPVSGPPGDSAPTVSSEPSTDSSAPSDSPAGPTPPADTPPDQPPSPI